MGEARTRGMSWSVALRLGRVSNLPTVWTNVVAGVALAGGSVLSAQTAALAVAMSLFYTAGMYLNDAFDREFDRQERPERPIPSGEISVEGVFAAGFTLLVAGFALLAWAAHIAAEGGGWRGIVAGGVLAGLIIVYDAWHKGNPFGPLLMGLCRAMIYLVAALVVTGRLPGGLVAAAAIVFAYVVGLTYAARQEGLNCIENLWPLALLGAPFVYAVPLLASGAAGAALYLGFAAWVAYALRDLIGSGRRNVPRAVVAMIAGISLLDATLIALAGRMEIAWIVVAGFLIALAGQRRIAGT